MGRRKKGELPSGSIRTRVYIGKDANGKRQYRSFTGRCREDLDLAVAAFKASGGVNDQESEAPVLTVAEAVRRYIELKRAVLSPATVRGYEGMERIYINADSIGRRDVEELSPKDVQLWVSSLAGKVSPKTVRNAYGLLASAVKMFRPSWVPQATLPQKQPADLYCPSDADIRRLLDHVRGTQLEICVMLGAFGQMRRSEICALEYSDIRGTSATVSKALVRKPDGGFALKPPKTPGSFRTVELPQFVVDRIGTGEGRIVKTTPDKVTEKFILAVKESGCPHFRFHDLRHYSASIMHAIGVPDQYIMQRGGWSSDYVMKRVYRDVIEDEAVKQNEKITDHFSAVVG